MDDDGPPEPHIGCGIYAVGVMLVLCWIILTAMLARACS